MGLYKRGKVWWMFFTFNGRQIRRSAETTNKKLAEKFEAKVKADVAEGKWLDVDPGKNTTFKELLEKYLAEHSIKKSGDLGVKRDRFSSKHLLRFFGGFTLNEITPRLISEYKARRYKAGRKPATINRELSLMKHAFTLATREWELCRDNPVKRVSMEKENNARDRWINFAEEERLLKYCDDRLKELVVFATNTGMRLEEMLSLCWKNVDLVRGVAIVVTSKNGEKRTLPLNRTVLELLIEKTRVRYLTSDYVFTTSVGTRLDQGNLRRRFIKARKKAKLGDLRIHDLRHTFATRMVQAGVDLYKVQKLLGHKTPAMTQRYAHHFTESLRDGVEALDEAKEKSYHNFITFGHK